MPGEQRDDEQERRLCQRVLRERQHARVAQQIGGQHPPQRRGDAGDEHEHRPEQRGEHATGAEQQPENGCVGALHACHAHMAANKAAQASSVAAQPVRVIVAGLSRRAPMKIIGIVLGMMSNQLLA